MKRVVTEFLNLKTRHFMTVVIILPRLPLNIIGGNSKHSSFFEFSLPEFFVSTMNIMIVDKTLKRL